MRIATTLPELMASFERRIIVREIKRRCTYTAVAKALGISRTRLVYRRKILGIVKEPGFYNCKRRC